MTASTMSLVHATVEAHHEGVIALPLETWVWLGCVALFGVVLHAAIRREFGATLKLLKSWRRELEEERLRNELRSEWRAGLADMEFRLSASVSELERHTNRRGAGRS